MSAPAKKLGQMVIARGDGGGSLTSHFMPPDISFGRSVQWKTGGETQVVAPSIEFERGDLRKISFTLLFNDWENATAEGTTASAIEFIENLAIGESATGEDKKSENAPPLCTISWGPASFQTFRGYIENYSVSDIFMKVDNTVIRASISCSFIEDRTAAK